MLLAIDPGPNTGMAFRLDDGKWATITINPDRASGVPEPDIRAVLREIVSRLKHIEVVVIESFIGFQMQSAYGISTMELIGAVRGVCLMINIPVVKQTPAMRKSQEENAKDHLKQRRTEMGLRFTPHEVSALSHLLRWENAVARATKKLESKELAMKELLDGVTSGLQD